MLDLSQIKSYFFPLLIEGKCKIRPKSSYPLKPSRKCLFCLMYKTITSIQKNLMSLLRMKRTMVNSWRGLIASPTAHILYQPPELLISKRRKTFPALVHNTKRQMVWNDLRRFSSFLKNLNRVCAKLRLTGHLPNNLENFCIQKEEGFSTWERFSLRNHHNHCKYFCHWLYKWLYQHMCFSKSPHSPPTKTSQK